MRIGLCILASAVVPVFAHAAEQSSKESPAAVSVPAPSFEEAKKLYDEGKLNQARTAFEKLIEANPSDTESRRYIKSIISIQRKMTHRDQSILERDRILDVRRSWIPIERKPEDRAARGTGDGQGRQQRSMQERVRQVIPEINFTDAQVRDVLQYLSKISDVNIVFDEGVSASAVPSAQEGEGQEKTNGGGVDVTKALASRITIALKDVPMIEALKYILAAKGLKYRVDEFAIVVSNASRLESVEMETRYYYLSTGTAGFTPHKSSVGQRQSQEGEETVGVDEGDAEESPEGSKAITIKDVLAQSGVPFPPGSKIFLDKRTGILIVRNTPSNLAVIEKIINALDVAPFQVAIEAKFVDIQETVMQELGLEAFLTGNFALTKQDGNNDLTILQNANNTTYGQFTGATQGRGGLTKGIRFLNQSGSSTNPAGNIFSVAQVLTQPQFQLVLHALEQSGMANVLSAPKVTTVNNQEAKIEVVTEIIYPSEYEVTPATTSSTAAVITPGVAIPGGFVSRDTGVILEVTPSVGADKKTISLTLRPEVSALSGWNNFGVSAGPSNLGTNAIPILQPIFTSQNVSTNVITRDGDTVVLGGLIREVTDTTDDKIPILGDIPGIGRAFRNQSTNSTKRNLLIFVTAYLLAPDGETVREPRYKKTKIFNP